MRKCSQCGIEDKPLTVPGDIECLQPDHLVTLELRYIPSEVLTAQQIRKGWSYKPHKGRHAMYRHICRPCLIQSEDMDRDARRVREKHLLLEQEQRGVDSVYSIYNDDYV